MLETVSAAIVGAGVGAFVCFLWVKKSYKNQFSHLEYEAKAKAKAIENEAELLLKASHVKIQEKELAQVRDFQERTSKIDERERALMLQAKEYSSKEEKLHILEQDLLAKIARLDKLEEQKNNAINATIDKMQNVASFTKEEAKKELSKIRRKISKNAFIYRIK